MNSNPQPIDLKSTGPDPKGDPASNLRAKPSKQFMTRRGQIFAMGLGMLIFLLCFTVPAMWEHIGSLKPQYETMAKIGALSPEFAIFCFLLFHSWDRSMKVRKWSLIFGCVLAGLVIVHAAGLWGLKDGAQRQEGIENRLTEKLTEYGKQTAEAIENRRPAGQAMTRTEVREQGRVARARDASAHALIAKEINGRTQEIHKASFLSEGYLNGPMYMVNFLVALLFVSALTWMHFTAKIDDIDEDGDGVADIKQGKVVNYQGQDYALNPGTGQADPQWADFLKWREAQEAGFEQIKQSPQWTGKQPEEIKQSPQWTGQQPQGPIPAPWPSTNRGGQFNRDGAIDLEPEKNAQSGPNVDSQGRTYHNTPLGPKYDEGQIMIERNGISEPAIKPAPAKIPVTVQSTKDGKDPNV